MGKLKFVFLFLLLPFVLFAANPTIHLDPQSAAPFACDPSRTGTLYSSASTLYFCNAADWVVLSSVDSAGAFSGDTSGIHSGPIVSALNAVTGTDALTAADCGKITTVTAGIDTHTLTLPEASTVIGCTFHIVYIGADGGALLDISPLDSDADGIEGTCDPGTDTAPVTFSGTDRKSVV